MSCRFYNNFVFVLTQIISQHGNAFLFVANVSLFFLLRVFLSFDGEIGF